MERKFESELAKKFAEGKRPKTSRSLGLTFAAVAVMVMFTGAAVFSLATTAKATQSAVDEDVLLPGEVDFVMVTDDDVAAKRTVNLKYRSVTPPGDNCDVDKFKLAYTTSLAIKADGSGIKAGDAIGNLNVTFTTGNLIDMVTISAVVEIFYGDAWVFSAGADPNYPLMLTDEDDAKNVLNVTAAIPTDYTGELTPGYYVYISISIVIDDTPDLEGEVVEQPFPDRYVEDDITGELVHEFDEHLAAFPT